LMRPTPPKITGPKAVAALRVLPAHAVRGTAGRAPLRYLGPSPLLHPQDHYDEVSMNVTDPRPTRVVRSLGRRAQEKQLVVARQTLFASLHWRGLGALSFPPNTISFFRHFLKFVRCPCSHPADHPASTSITPEWDGKSVLVRRNAIRLRSTVRVQTKQGFEAGLQLAGLRRAGLQLEP
jgi:hypothetical protein